MGNFFTDNPAIEFYIHRHAHVNANEHVHALACLGHLAADTIAPNAGEADKNPPMVVDDQVAYSQGTLDSIQAIFRSGLYGMTMPEKYRGLDYPYSILMASVEMMARADLSFSTLWSLQSCADILSHYASEEIKAHFLPFLRKGATCSMDLTEPDAGSDLQSIKLSATYDEASQRWLLNGIKRYITNGGARIHLVLARSESNTTDARGLSLFVCDREEGGISIHHLEEKMGLHGSPTAELVFKDAPAYLIGERRMGLIRYTSKLLNVARLCVGAQAVGLSETAWQEASMHAARRKQFGHPIADIAQVQELLDNIRCRTDAIRSLLYETSHHSDLMRHLTRISEERPLSPEERKEQKQELHLLELLTPLLKMLSSEWANRNAYDALQVCGGVGFSKRSKAEQLYRDARVLTIYEGTSQMQVVAMQRGLTNGGYLEMLRQMPNAAQFEAQIQQLATVLDSPDASIRYKADRTARLTAAMMLCRDAEIYPQLQHSAAAICQPYATL